MALDHTDISNEEMVANLSEHTKQYLYRRMCRDLMSYSGSYESFVENKLTLETIAHVMLADFWDERRRRLIRTLTEDDLSYMIAELIDEFLDEDEWNWTFYQLCCDAFEEQLDEWCYELVDDFFMHPHNEGALQPNSNLQDLSCKILEWFGATQCVEGELNDIIETHLAYLAHDIALEDAA